MVKNKHHTIIIILKVDISDLQTDIVLQNKNYFLKLLYRIIFQKIKKDTISHYTMKHDLWIAYIKKYHVPLYNRMIESKHDVTGILVTKQALDHCVLCSTSFPYFSWRYIHAELLDRNWDENVFQLLWDLKIFKSLQ